MSFKPGHKKIGGRKKGTPNRKTEDMVDQMAKLKLCPLSGLARLIDEVSPETQVKVYLQLLTYLYPKRKAVEVEAKVDVQEPLAALSDPELADLARQVIAIEKVKGI